MSTQVLVRIQKDSAHEELVKKYNRQTQVGKLSSTISLFIWEARLGEGSFWIKVLTLIQNIMENRLRHARGPVQLHIKSIIYMSTLPSQVLNVLSLRTGHSGSETFNFKFALNVMNWSPFVYTFSLTDLFSSLRGVLEAECSFLTKLRQQHMLNEKTSYFQYLFFVDWNATEDNIIIFE